MKLIDAVGKMIVFGSMIVSLTILINLWFMEEMAITEPNKYILGAEIFMILFGIVYFADTVVKER